MGIALYAGCAVLLLAAAVLYLRRALSALLPGDPADASNIFREDARQPVRPLETDQAKRDAVLKQLYQPKKVPTGLDAIVIGSGAGGLCCAAVLARAGRRVLVLEQHDQAGGCCHTFHERGYEFDTGIHYIGDRMNDPHRSGPRCLLDQISDGQTEWQPMDQVFDTVYVGGQSYPFAGGKNPETGRWRFHDMLLSRFPAEEEGLARFFDLLAQAKGQTIGFVAVKLLPLWLVRALFACGVAARVFGFFAGAQRPVQSVLDEVTADKELQAVLGYCFGDYGTVPTKAPWGMHAILINHYMVSGAFYPVGGSSQIAYNIIPGIERAGGRVLVKARVASILLDGGAAVGVRMAKDGAEIRAPLVVSAAGALNTYTRLLPQPQPHADAILRKVPAGCTCMTLFVGLDAPGTELGVKGQNHWVYRTSDTEADMARFVALSREELLDAEFDVPMMFVSFPSEKDPSWPDRFPGKTTCEVITIANYEWFDDWKTEQVMKRGDDYAQLKRVLGDKMWTATLRLFPQLRDHVEYFDVASPVTNNHYLNALTGEMYGLDHTLPRFSPSVAPLLRPETPYRGLYLTGQDVMTCGFVSALFAGAVTASSILRRNVLLDMERFMKRRAKAEAPAKK